MQYTSIIACRDCQSHITTMTVTYFGHFERVAERMEPHGRLVELAQRRRAALGQTRLPLLEALVVAHLVHTHLVVRLARELVQVRQRHHRRARARARGQRWRSRPHWARPNRTQEARERLTQPAHVAHKARALHVERVPAISMYYCTAHPSCTRTRTRSLCNSTWGAGVWSNGELIQQIILI